MTPADIAEQIDALAAQLKTALTDDALTSAPAVLASVGSAAQHLGGALRVIAADALTEHKATGREVWDDLAEECFDAATLIVSGGSHVEQHAVPAAGDASLAVTR